MQSASEARLWLAWLKVRILIVTLLLGIELALAQFTPVSFPMRLFIDALLLAYTISIFHLALLKFWRELRVQSALQVATDLLLVSLLIYVTGGADSSLNFLYPLVIIVASVLLSRRWAYFTAAIAFIFYGGVLELCYFQVIPSYSTTHPGLRTRRHHHCQLDRLARSPIWQACWPPSFASGHSLQRTQAYWGCRRFTKTLINQQRLSQPRSTAVSPGERFGGSCWSAAKLSWSLSYRSSRMKYSPAPRLRTAKSGSLPRIISVSGSVFSFLS